MNTPTETLKLKTDICAFCAYWISVDQSTGFCSVRPITDDLTDCLSTCQKYNNK